MTFTKEQLQDIEGQGISFNKIGSDECISDISWDFSGGKVRYNLDRTVDGCPDSVWRYKTVDEFNAIINDGTWEMEGTFESLPEIKANRYTIEPATYTRRDGKVLNMFLLKLNDDVEVSFQVASKIDDLCKQYRGWYDRKRCGWMLRSEMDAESLATDIHANDLAELYIYA
ncbi:MAG: hypothetical protein LUI09_06095 [Prevotellaceae bacterium]|nr:hypothetical protein [Prevotellaceae bacterium]